MNNLPEELHSLFSKHELQLGIGDLSRVTGVTQSKIRYWEQKGYIHAVKNDEGQNHKYSLPMIGKTRLIKHFLDEGFTLQAAVDKAEEHRETMDMVQKVLTDRFLSFIKFEGHDAINMGPLKNDPDKSVIAVLSSGKTELQLVPSDFD
ncbi:MerR family transcriptional regulator [Paucilactobacillus suebicus]|uniref:Regulatory protein MerR n=1 Tax=Paucilactobacillus suebicus DSM 5007 = KCTC 3549 TaxID=1423807 RepID=A0A0R1W757_9LACO|nr:MerR family transcriptional regulator [Paucilactobacillus suebicus]KRM13405.1 regulatory protein MerR [Paucilactobacillus suebicus DSM 5007 = KCTC 3549]